MFAKIVLTESRPPSKLVELRNAGRGVLAQSLVGLATGKPDSEGKVLTGEPLVRTLYTRVEQELLLKKGTVSFDNGE